MKSVRICVNLWCIKISIIRGEKNSPQASAKVLRVSALISRQVFLINPVDEPHLQGQVWQCQVVEWQLPKNLGPEINQVGAVGVFAQVIPHAKRYRRHDVQIGESGSPADVAIFVALENAVTIVKAEKRAQAQVLLGKNPRCVVAPQPRVYIHKYPGVVAGMYVSTDVAAKNGRHFFGLWFFQFKVSNQAGVGGGFTKIPQSEV